MDNFVLTGIASLSILVLSPASDAQSLQVATQQSSAEKARAISIPVRGLDNSNAGQIDVILSGQELTVIDYRPYEDRNPNDGQVTTFELFGGTDAAGVPVPMQNQSTGTGSTAQVVHRSEKVTIVVVTTESGAEFVVTINNETGATTTTPAS